MMYTLIVIIMTLGQPNPGRLEISGYTLQECQEAAALVIQKTAINPKTHSIETKCVLTEKDAKSN